MIRLALAVLLSAVAVGVVVVTATGASDAEDVTLRMERFYDNACRCYKFRFFGTIASGVANEYVSVLQQRCGQKFSVAVGGALTREGGSWEAVPSSIIVGGSATFRARWNNSVSEPVTYRSDFPLSVSQLGGGRTRVSVTLSDTPAKLKGRVVELQRLRAGQWTRFRAARLVARPGSGGRSFFATFVVRARGLTLRAFAPAATAGRCYTPTASNSWVTGTPPPAGAERVIDRTLVCSIAVRGGVWELSVSASGSAANLFVPQRSIGASTNWIPDASLASLSTELLVYNPTRCLPSRASVPLVRGGLKGGSVSADSAFECQTPPRVLMRVRAVFTAPTALQEDRTWGYRQLLARGEITEAALAIRTQGGKPLAFASLSGAGDPRLVVAGGCVEDDN